AWAVAAGNSQHNTSPASRTVLPCLRPFDICGSFIPRGSCARASRAKRIRGRTVFCDGVVLAASVIHVVGLETGVPLRAGRERPGPVAAGTALGVAFLIRYPPTVERIGARSIRVWGQRAVAVLKGCNAVMSASTMERNGSIRALPRGSEIAGVAVGVE